MLQQLQSLINIECRCYMSIEGWTNTTYPWNVLFKRAKITGQEVVLAYSIMPEFLILLTSKLEGETSPSVKVWIHLFFPSARDVQPLTLEPTPSTSEPRAALNMWLSWLQGPSVTHEKRKGPAYSGNSTVEILNRTLDTIWSELLLLPYEDLISIAYCTTDNSELIQLQQNKFASSIFLHALIQLQH